MINFRMVKPMLIFYNLEENNMTELFGQVFINNLNIILIHVNLLLNCRI